MEGREVRGRISAICSVRKKASPDMAGRFLEDWDGVAQVTEVQVLV